MSKKSSFWNYVLIVCFATGLVAIGARELHREYFPTSSQLKRSRPTNLSDALHGETIERRGKLDWKKTERASTRQNSSRRRNPKSAESNQNTSSFFGGGFFGDGLNRNDKQELGELLDEVNP